MIRRILTGVSLVLTLLLISTGYSYAQTATLQVCIIANPDDVCTADNGLGGGGGGGGGGEQITPPVAFSPVSGEVFFSGTAYPGAVVTLMSDGKFVASTTASANAQFQFDISGVTPGTYTYGAWFKDATGVRSVVNSFSVVVAEGVGTVISGIYLPPTIDADKSQVKKGDPITLFGAAVPFAEVGILISPTYMKKIVTADVKGNWWYMLETLGLDYGLYEVTAKWSNATGTSPTSSTLQFIVGQSTISINRAAYAAADISGDGHVDAADFSILAYWFKRPVSESGKKADLNHDGKVDAKDFSILAYYWSS